MAQTRVIHATLVFVVVIVSSGYGFSEIDQKKLILGRQYGHKCNQHYGVLGNKTFVITSDDYPLHPPCSVVLTGYKEENNTQKYSHLCYEVMDLFVPCDAERNNTIMFEKQKLLVHNNETLFRSALSEDIPFDCNWSKARLPLLLCSNIPFRLNITMHIFNNTFKESPNIRVRTIQAGQKELSWANFRIHEMTNCGPDNHCMILLTENKSDEDSDSTIDINNLITIIFGAISSLMIPVLLLLARNRILDRRNTTTDDRKPGDGAEDKKSNDDEDIVPSL
ncbi:Hypothetical predicted protein [Mytilus galloprovincialis]|uniref:CUB domain-containing protein n=1 Tax=Mytilus galloprovincialis TaxID=29158 RepID=A0A8B6DAI6_MYTGA|nr:Hypothetical predicted protein [Mytilus galloprovincialis]